MDCECWKNGKCEHQDRLDLAIDKILEVNFGSANPAWEDFEKLVKKNCQHRKKQTPPSRKTHSGKVSKESLDALDKYFKGGLKEITVEEFKNQKGIK